MKKKLKGNQRRNLKNSFSYGAVDIWDRMDKEVLCTYIVENIKTALDTKRHKDEKQDFSSPPIHYNEVNIHSLHLAIYEYIS